jgi:hypothetical protein
VKGQQRIAVAVCNYAKRLRLSLLVSIFIVKIGEGLTQQTRFSKIKNIGFLGEFVRLTTDFLKT